MYIYLDSAPIIYLLENVSPYGTILQTRLAQPNIIQVCSELSRLECRVKPIRDQQPAILAAFDSYFADIIGFIVPISRTVLESATELRAKYGFKTPDAIHLAAAMSAKCDVFLTNDHRLRRCTDITIEVL